MSHSFRLADDVAARLVAEAASRNTTPDELAAELIAARLANLPTNTGGHRLSFAGIGASSVGRRARDDEAMLAEGLGR